MAIEIFNRYEHKYKLDTKTFNKVLENLIRIAANIRFIP